MKSELEQTKKGIDKIDRFLESEMFFISQANMSNPIGQSSMFIKLVEHSKVESIYFNYESINISAYTIDKKAN